MEQWNSCGSKVAKRTERIVGLALSIALLLIAEIAHAATYTVTTTNDAGAGSLRAAITSANGAAGADTIRFNIAGAGVRTITLASALPTITGQVFIDGYSQSGASVNTSEGVNNAVLRIELNGNNLVGTGFTISGDNCTIRGLVMNRFTTNSISLTATANGTLIQGNFLGTNATGTAASGTGNGILVAGGFTTIGGIALGERNQLSGSTTSAAIRLTGASCTNNQVLNNFIGLSSDGGTVIGGIQVGVRADLGATINAVGGLGGSFNKITGATNQGVVVVDAATRLDLRSNYIWGNGGLGIDLGNDGITLNDIGDGDSGPNDLQNFPVITNAVSDMSGRVYVDFTFSGVPSTNYRFDFFANADADPTHGEGQYWIGEQTFPTDGAGNGNYHITVGTGNAIPAGTRISATATHLTQYRTSEFAANVACTGQRLTVTNTSDVVNGDVTSVISLLNNPGADGISLREAIRASNNNKNGWTANHIFFDLPGAGPQTILPLTALPIITTSTALDGFSDPEYAGTPVVHVRGSSAGAAANGLVFFAPYVSVRGLSITHFGGDGIQMNNAFGSLVGSHIGVMPDGTTCGANGGIGVRITDGSNCTLGDETLVSGPNVISGNTNGGVLINGGMSRNTRLFHTYLGTNVAGTAGICTQPFGVSIAADASLTTIGSAIAGKRNVISGHTQHGIIGTSTGTEVINSFIGTNLAGTAAIPNGVGGIDITGADTYIHHSTVAGNIGTGIRLSGVNVLLENNKVGVNSAGTAGIPNTNFGVELVSCNIATVGGSGVGNTISGNGADGLVLTSCAGTTVKGNFIGTNSAGTAALGNANDGLFSRNNTTGSSIGGITAAERNIVSGNGDHGICHESGTNNITILGNYVGLGADGSTMIPNTDAAVYVDPTSNNITIGGTAIGAGNTISGNADYGVWIEGSNVTLLGNRIGTDASGTTVKGNGDYGILINGTSNTIGGTAPGSTNVIAGNFGAGIRIANPGTTGNVVLGNYIGTNAAGNFELGTTANGILIQDNADGNTIGGASAAARNIITGEALGILIDNNVDNTVVLGNHVGVAINGSLDLNNANAGIRITNNCTGTQIGNGTVAGRNVISRNQGGPGVEIIGGSANTIRGNYIGINAAGTGSAMNRNSVVIRNSANNVIGGSLAGDRNVLGTCSSSSVLITDAGSTGNIVRGNLIGLFPDSLTSAGSGGECVLIQAGAANNFIGGTNAGDANAIRNSTYAGVRVTSDAGTGNAILRNSIDNNGLLGIDLAFNAVTANDAMDVDGGGNGTQNYPVLTSVISTGGNTIIKGTLNSTASSTFRLEFFSSPVGDVWLAGEGRVFLGTTNVTTNASGNAVVNVTLPVSATVGHVVSATATNSGNSTSEFSLYAAVSAGYDISGTVFEDVNYGGGAGRDRSTAITGGGSGRPNARVELFDASGNFVTFTTTNASGAYTFSSLAPATYTVRVVNSSVTSARTGYVAPLIAVQTFCTEVDTDIAYPASDKVGGNVPNKVDAGNGSTTLAALTTATTTAQSTVAVAVGSSNITGVDFGYSFNVVCNTNNSGQGSLREFILHANALSNTGLAIQGRTAGIDHAIFMISNGTAAAGLRASNNFFTMGVATITPTTFLTHIIAPVVIDAQTQPGWTSVPIIELNGNGGNASGLRFMPAATASVVRGLIIKRFANEALELEADGMIVQGCYVGTDATGTIDQGSGTSGVLITGDNCLIGGTTVAARNVISGNDWDGIQINGGNNTTITGNYIGTNASGTGGIGNARHGIELDAASANCSIVGNLISGNTLSGIVANPSSGTVNNLTIAGNTIGLNAAGSTALANGVDGIVLLNVNGAVIGTNGDGTNDAAERNIISGNTDDGIEPNVGISNIRIAGNYIGTDITGMLDRGNGQIGIHPVGGGCIIGTNADGVSDVLERNIISGNENCGISMIGAGAINNVVAGNWIGLNSAGTGALGNTQGGVRCMLNANNNRIGTNADGTNDAAEGNVICASGWNGVEIFSGSTGNTVAGNYIGLRPDGVTAQGNVADGIHINAASMNTIGGTAAAARNVIAANGQDGIQITAFGSSANTILGNYIGTNASGNTALANTQNGIRADFQANGTIIGGSAAGSRNVISGNTLSGVYIDQTSNGVMVLGNYIGLGANGSTDVGNGGSGVFATNNSVGTTVGNGTPEARNVISGNGGDGVHMNTGANFSSIRGNYIGTNAAGNAAVPNLTGITIFNSNNHDIGGPTAAHGNVISGNTNLGIQLANAVQYCNLRNNLIGVQVNGTSALGNGLDGIRISGGALNNTIGGTAAGSSNTIAHNGFIGIRMETDAGLANSILTNSIRDNGALGIDLHNDGPTLNDAGDGDTGANERQNFPVLTSAAVSGGDITIRGTMNSAPSTSYRLEYFSSPTADPSGYGEGASFIGTETVTTNPSGTVPLNVTFSGAPAVGHKITSTATKLVAGVPKSTSEFSGLITSTLPPVAVCQDPTLYLNASGVATLTPAMADGGSYDPDGSIVSMTVSQTSFTCANLGDVGALLVVTDNNGAAASCSTFVHVVDTIRPVISGCPANINQPATNGCFAMVWWPQPTVSDNCAGATITRTSGPATGFIEIGTHTVVYTATDASGNTSTCSFTITIVDNIPPYYFNCPGNITVNAAPGTCSADISASIGFGIADNCVVVTDEQIAGPDMWAPVPVGVHTMTRRITDRAGATATCTFIVTVVDNQAPVISGCPSNIVRNANADCEATATWTVPSFSDNCPGGSIVRTSGPAPGSTFPKGVTTITYTATDASGNTATCSFTVTVNDVTPPMYIMCPGNQTRYVLAGQCTRAITGLTFGFTDNCSGTTSVQTSGTTMSVPMPVGVHPVTFNITDAAGNPGTSTCSFTVTVLDTIRPTISCPANITTNLVSGCTKDVSWTPPTASDNCNVTLTQTAGPAPGGSFPVGTTTVTYLATDASGNTRSCSFTVTVLDAIAPTLVCPSDIIVENTPGSCGAVVNYTEPVGTDNCAGITTIRTAGLASGSTFPVGPTNITYQATDAAGNVTTCSFRVIVNDTEVPTITCPANISVNAAAGACSAVVTYADPEPTDNCGNATITRVFGPASGSSFPIGTTWVGYEISQGGQTRSCAFSVTVVDATAPVIVGCPGNISRNTGPMGCGQTATWTVPTFTDNCAGGNITRTAGPAPGSLFPVGTTPVTYTATDAAGNTATCTFTVTVVDVTPPKFIACQGDLNVNVDPGTCTADVSMIVTFTYNDNCGVTNISQTSGSDYEQPLTAGVHPMTFTLTDPAGNTATCSFTVTVVDNIAPAISCPGNITVNNTPGICGAVVNYTAPVGTDNCAGSTTVMTAGLASGSQFPVGTTTVTYQVTDAAGLSASCSFTVTVNDTEAPVAVCQPVTIGLNGSGVANLAPSQVDGGSTDNCAITSMTVVPNSFNTVGPHTVTLTVFDAAGNSDDCTVTVTVQDNNAPTAVCQPVSIYVDAAGNASIVAADIDGGSTDNGTIVSLVASQTAFDCSDLGQNNVTLTVTDDGGNSDNCVAVVTVVDNIAPTAICQNITVQLNASGNATITAAQIDNGSTDNCGIASITASQTAFTCSNLGANTVVLTVTDASGNSSTCNATVTIQDNTAPAITCPANISVNNGAGACGAVVNYTAPVGTDNCAGATTTRTAGLASGSTFPVGVNTVTYQVTDAAGKSVSCSFTVTVVDVTVPVIVGCPSNISMNAGAACTATATWTAPTFTDNCAGVTIALTSGLAPGSSFPIGTTTVIYTATDAAGNTATCSFTVTVVDVTAPVIVGCPSNITVNAGAGCTATATWTVPTFTDNCTGASIALTAGLAPGSTFPIGTTTVTYTATDAAGNPSTCSFTVTVVDVTAPSISCPANITVNNGAGICGAVVNYTTPVGTDNCTGATTAMTAGFASGSTFPMGTTTVTYQVTDAAGLTANCSFTVTVIDAEAPVAICQAVSVNLDGSGTATITAAQVNNGSTDNCAIVSMTLSQYTFNAVGTYSVTLTVTDAAGNSDDCTITVTVTDNNPPTAVCQNITVTLDASGNAVINSADLDGGSTDNGTIVSIVASQTSFDCSDVGTVTVTLTVTDDGGNVSTCDATVTVVDNIAPVAICQNISVNLDASGNATITAAQINNGSSENCAGFTLSASQTTFDCSDIGANTVTLTVTDASGNVSTCDATVTIVDNSAPTIVCNNITVNLDASGQVVVDAADVATATTDNCGAAQIGYSLSQSVFTGVGSFTVTVTATDAAGNSSSCSATITVTDTNPPVAVCQPVTIYLDAAGNTTIVAAEIDGGSTDNGTIVSLIASQTAFDCSDLGPNNVTLTVTDDGGNSDDCIAIVTVLDTIAPTAVCQNINAYLDASGNVTITGADLNGGSSDNCGTATLTYSASTASFDCSDLGPQTVTLTVTDASGNSSMCSATVNVQDTIAPTLACADATINVDGNGWAVITANAIATWSDNCSSGLSAWTSTDSVNVVGDTTIWVFVQDITGNIDSCMATVTVSDNNPPVAVCQPVTIYLDAAGNATIVAADIDGGSTDNGAIVSIVASQTAFDCSDLGPNNVTLTVTDDGGNSDDCIAIVTVLDTIAPTAVCQNINAYLDASGNVTITGADLNGGSSDNCGTGTLTYSTSTASFDCSNLGPQTVALTVTDASGNSSMCSATVNVQDTIAPTLACADATINVDGNGWAVITANAIATWSDNCSSGLTSWTSTDSVNVLGDTTIWVYVQDITGNIDSCMATVIVSDNNPPVAVCQPVTIYLDAAGSATIVAADIDGGSTDNGTIVSIVASQTSFDCGHLGDNSVTLTVTDNMGNLAECVAVVTVLDTIAPTVMCQDVTLYLDENGAATLGNIDLVSSSDDNCGITNTTTSMSYFENVGGYNVVVTVEDASGNTSFCTAHITVTDTIIPQSNCNVFGGILVYLDQNGTVEIAAEDIDSGSVDNDTIVSMTLSQYLFDCSDLGSNSVVLTVNDAAGNVNTCTTLVTVLDTIAPMVACQNITIMLDNNGQAVITANDVVSSSADNCGAGELSYSTDVTSFSSGGMYSVVLTVTDASGNTSSCEASVTVISPEIPPVAVCQPVTIYVDANGNASIVAADIDGGSTDNGTIVSITASQTNFDCSDLGTNDVTLTVTDNMGLSASCVADVTVLDTIAPTVSCQNITIELDVNGQVPIIATDIDGGSTDNCGGELTYSTDVTSFSNEDTYIVTLTVTDASGNSSMCTATVTVDGPRGVLTIPSGFSPNGDGISDTWVIHGLDKYPNNSIQIFNRWGTKIHAQAPYQNDWTGFSTANATLPGDLPAGTYFYILELGEGEDARTGYIQINR